MYGWWEPSQDDLVSIDKATGVATRVGESGLDTAAFGLSFDTAGMLYLYNYDGVYYTIDTATGSSTYVGNLGVLAHHGHFRPDTNVYYGISDPFTGSPSRDLIMLDLHNGSNLGSMPTVDNLHTLAWVYGPYPVPEPAFLQLPALMGLGGIGMWWRRRRTA